MIGFDANNPKAMPAEDEMAAMRSKLFVAVGSLRHCVLYHPQSEVFGAIDAVSRIAARCGSGPVWDAWVEEIDMTLALIRSRFGFGASHDRTMRTCAGCLVGAIERMLENEDENN